MAAGSNTSSEWELKPIALPTTCERRPSRPRPKRFIICLGSFAGDFWHCAAATVLSHYQRTDTSAQRPFRDVEFIVCIVITVNKAGERVDKWMIGARKMFTYFRAISVPCMIITTPSKGQKSDHTIKSLSDSQVLACWKDQERQPYAKTVDEVFEQKRKTTVDHEMDVEKSGCILRHEAGTSVLMELARYFGQKDTCAILAYRLSRASGLKNLEDGKGDAIERQAQKRIERQVQERIESLDEIISETQGFAGKKKLIFNYRYTDWNPQHDGTRGILDQVKALAAEENTVVIVLPAMTERYLEDQIKPDDKVFYLYEKPKDEKQYETGRGLSYEARARFWVRVAQRAKDWKLIGMIGGRSGSMDIPAFVGLRCLSWDEPIFQVKEAQKKGSIWVIPTKESKDDVDVESSVEETKSKTKGKEKRKKPDTAVEEPSGKKSTIPPSPWATSHWTEQGHQSLRLLNQIDLMHVTFSKRSAVDPFRQRNTWKRRYNALEEQDPRLGNFLKNPKNEPLVSLGFEPVKGWSEWVVRKYRGKLESTNMNVTAINLQSYIDEARLIGTTRVYGVEEGDSPDESEEDDSPNESEEDGSPDESEEDGSPDESEEDESGEKGSWSDESNDGANSYSTY